VQKFDGTGNGILIAPPSGGADVLITNTFISNIANPTGTGGAGINLSPTGDAGVAAVIDHIVVTGTNTGILLQPNTFSIEGTHATISNSTLSHNTDGIFADNLSSSTFGALAVSIDTVIASENSIGIQTGGNNVNVFLTRSGLHQNQYGIFNRTNTFYTYKDNRIDGSIQADICQTSPCLPLNTVSAQ
jgi:hypothetical protein